MILYMGKDYHMYETVLCGVGLDSSPPTTTEDLLHQTAAVSRDLLDK